MSFWKTVLFNLARVAVMLIILALLARGCF